jgi:hypothetical protein
MTIVHVLGNVEDERHFSFLAFLKNKLQATLDLHLPLVVGMHCQKRKNLKTFPYATTFDAWIGVADRYGGYCVDDTYVDILPDFLRQPSC